MLEPWIGICPVCSHGEMASLSQQNKVKAEGNSPLEKYLKAENIKEKAVKNIFKGAFKIKINDTEEIKHEEIEKKAEKRIDWWIADQPIQRVVGTNMVMERFHSFGGHHYLNEEAKNKISLADIRSYQGKKREITARFLVENFTNHGDVVLDTFAGSGMLSLIAKVTGRKPMAFDILRSACSSTKALISTPKRSSIIKVGKDIVATANDIEADMSIYPKSIKKWYDLTAFKEAVKFYEVIDKEMIDPLQDDKRMKNFQMQIALYILARISYGRGGYSWKIEEKEFRKRQLWDKDMGEEYMRHIGKVTRSNMDNLYDTNFEVHQQSIIEDTGFRNGSVDRIVTDPPYGDMINYLAQVWVEEWYLGWRNIVTMDELLGTSATPKKALDFAHKHMIQDVDTFFQRMEMAMKEMYRLLRADGTAVFIIGDFKEKNKRGEITAVNPFRTLEKIARKIGFEEVYVINKPFTRQSTYKHTHAGEQKYERIVLFKKGTNKDDIIIDRIIEKNKVGLEKWM